MGDERLPTPTTPVDPIADDDPVKLHLEERAQLIDAARENARTFDKAVLTFGSAVFGFSIAFLKDVAPHPAPGTLWWLGGAWASFSFGLLSILTSFLCGQQAFQFEITESTNALAPGYQRKKNRWSTAAQCGNVLCVVFLFFGLLCWSKFAFDNLSRVDTTATTVQTPVGKEGPKEGALKPTKDTSDTLPLKKTYTPPRTPPPPNRLLKNIGELSRRAFLGAKKEFPRAWAGVSAPEEEPQAAAWRPFTQPLPSDYGFGSYYRQRRRR